MALTLEVVDEGRKRLFNIMPSGVKQVHDLDGLVV